MARIAVPVHAFVHVLVEKRGLYVLIQEAKPEIGNPWCIPAGGVNPGETIVQAAVRETMEEAGLVVEPHHLMRIRHLIPRGQDVRSPDPELWWFTVVAEAIGGQLKTEGDEHSLQARWFHPHELAGVNVRAPVVLELIEMHRQGAPLLPIEAYVSQVAPFHFG